MSVTVLAFQMRKTSNITTAAEQAFCSLSFKGHTCLEMASEIQEKYKGKNCSDLINDIFFRFLLG